MDAFDFPVRSPTGTAWVATIASFIAVGELYVELTQSTTPVLLGRAYSPSTLWPVFGGACLVTILAATWLVTLYLRPGRFVLEPNAGMLRRVFRPRIVQSIVEFPLNQWDIRVVFFSEAERARGLFKRIELQAPGYSEVLLFTDLPAKSDPVPRLASLSHELKGWKEVILQASDVEAGQQGES